MSDNLPLEIHEEIIKRLPVKSLVQFRSVCKAWKSLIDTSRFIKHYSSQQQHLLIRYEPGYVFEDNYVSIVDDETFPHHRVSPTHPIWANIFHFHTVIGCSHGLLCLYASYGDVIHDRQRIALLWNISIRKAVIVVLPRLLEDMKKETYRTFIDFGVCPETTDPKIVKITEILSWDEMETATCIPWQVEVFTLSTGVWRPPYTNNLPRTLIQFGCSQVVVDGFCYWLATDRSIIDDEFQGYNLIISFHLTREEFREVNLPDSLLYNGSLDYLHIFNLRESLVVLNHDESENAFDVWLMEDGVSKSFRKLFNIYAPNATILRVLEFRKSGEPVIEISDDDDDPLGSPISLVVYEPKSKHISNLGIHGTGSFYAYSYVETLLLLDQPDFAIFGRR